YSESHNQAQEALPATNRKGEKAHPLFHIVLPVLSKFQNRIYFFPAVKIVPDSQYLIAKSVGSRPASHALSAPSHVKKLFLFYCYSKTTFLYMAWGRQRMTGRDRKSTRLNSIHVSISYAVFCLKTI